MTTEQYTLAIDLGTTALKVGLVSSSGKVVGLETEPNRLILAPGGGAEQDANDWWAMVRRAVARLIGRGLVPREAVTAVGCTAQWSGTVPVDRSGRPLMNAVIWMDSRGAADVRRITGGPVRVSGYGVDKLWLWLRKTGGIPAQAGKDSLAHILYLQREHPQVYAAAHKFLEPKDYLNLCLTGEFAASYESVTLYWVTENRDPLNIHYDPALLAAVGIDREKLPDLQPATAVVGRLRPALAQEWGLAPGVRVVAGTPDLHSAAIGSGATRDFEPHLYVGTSSWLTCHVPYKKTDLLHNMATLPSPIPGRYFVANEQETAGACLNHLRELLFQRDQVPAGAFGLFDEMAASAPPGSGGVLFTPWLYGERTPVEDHLVRGGFHNLSLQTTRQQLVRAVLEGVALNARWLLQAVEAFVGRRLDPIRMIGGGAKSDLWCQIYADVLGRAIHQVKDPVEAGVRGAAIVAMVGTNQTSFDAARGLVAVARSFEPRPGLRSLYDELFRAFLELYRRNRPVHARLNGKQH